MSGGSGEIPERLLRELVALADGRLRGRRRRRLEAELARSPELRRALAAQRRAVAALQSVEANAPTSLRRRLRDAGASSEPGEPGEPAQG